MHELFSNWIFFSLYFDSLYFCSIHCLNCYQLTTRNCLLLLVLTDGFPIINLKLCFNEIKRELFDEFTTLQSDERKFLGYSFNILSFVLTNKIYPY